MTRRPLVSLVLLAACATSSPRPTRALQVPAGIDASLIDSSAQPCDDFYRYACGGWLAQAVVPAGRPTWSRGFSELQQNNQLVLHALLEDYAQGRALAELPEAEKLGAFYASCMDTGALEAAALAPLEPELARVRVRSGASLEQAAAHLQSVGIAALFALSTQVVDGEVVLTLAPGGMGLPEPAAYRRDDDARYAHARAAYLAHVGRMLALSGLDASQSAAGAQAVLRIETELASAAEGRDFQVLDLDGLAQLAPHFDWAALLVDLGHPQIRKLALVDAAYFKKLDGLVHAISPADWSAYLRWRLLDGAAPELPARFADAHAAFGATVLGRVEGDAPRWQRCVQATQEALPLALARAFAARTLPTPSREAARTLVQRLEAELASVVAHAAHLDDAARRLAQAQLGGLTEALVAPQAETGLSQLELARGAFLRNAFSAHAAQVDRQLAAVGKPLDLASWDGSPAELDAHYSPARNQLVVAAGILQPPLFSAAYDDAVNLGALGAIVGHELVHAVDEAPALDGPRRCLAAQFSAYVDVDGVPVDGKQTAREDLADLAGLDLAFTALESRAPSSPPDAAFSPEQAFFVAHAQAFCRKDREAYARLLATVDPHAPARLRIDGVVANLPAFAQAFHCPASAPMVRANRCEVW